MTRIKVDPDRLEELGREMAALRREFETLDVRLDDFEAAAGHRRVADRLHHLASNWSDAREEVVEKLDSLATLASDAARFYREREAELVKGMDNSGAAGGG